MPFLFIDSILLCTLSPSGATVIYCNNLLEVHMVFQIKYSNIAHRHVITKGVTVILLIICI